MKPITRIDSSTIYNLLTGASLLAAGGGLSYPQQVASWRSLRKKFHGQSVPLLSVDKVNKHDWFVVCSEIGPTQLPPIAKDQAGKMIKILSTQTGRTIRGIVPFEIGEETITLETALYTGLPIVDADIAGGRATPTLDLTLPVSCGEPFVFSPLIAVDEQGKMTIKTAVTNAEDDEAFVCQCSMQKKGIIFFIGGMMNGAFIKKHLVASTYSQAIALGEAMRHGKEVDGYKGTYKIISIQKKDKGGFLLQRVLLEDGKGTYTLSMCNENVLIIHEKTQHIVAQAPDIIVLVDKIKRRGLNNGDLETGMKVDLYVLPSDRRFYSKDIRQAWHAFACSLFPEAL